LPSEELPDLSEKGPTLIDRVNVARRLVPIKQGKPAPYRPLHRSVQRAILAKARNQSMSPGWPAFAISGEAPQSPKHPLKASRSRPSISSRVRTDRARIATRETTVTPAWPGAQGQHCLGVHRPKNSLATCLKLLDESARKMLRGAEGAQGKNHRIGLFGLATRKISASRASTYKTLTPHEP
jgi:hypothetical protein